MLLAGVNCRDLATLQVVPGRLEKLARLCRRTCRGWPRAASRRAEDARRVAAAGYDLALVGSALMSGADPEALARDMIVAGRAAPRRWI